MYFRAALRTLPMRASAQPQQPAAAAAPALAGRCRRRTPMRAPRAADRGALWDAIALPEQLPPGKCWLAGVGPGSLEHVTLKVMHLVTRADVVVFDDLGAQELLRAAPGGAERVYVGKRGGKQSTSQAEIDSLLVSLCRQGRRTVRLKGGCPSTFSRVSSEAAALSAAGCDYEIVPAVSSATAAPVLAGLPLTDAELAWGYAVVSGHDAAAVDWGALRHVPTVVVLMGGRALPVIVERLLATGRAGDTPVAVVKSAGTPQQAVWFSTLVRVEQDTAPGAPLSPCIIVVGKVAGLPAAWKQQQHHHHHHGSDS